jgi:hypothetical protein
MAVRQPLRGNAMKRGMSYAEAMAYVGVKRRTFDAAWRPRLNPVHQGTSLIFDRYDLDRLFDELKGHDGGRDMPIAALAGSEPQAQNDNRNERPAPMKGDLKWAEKYRDSTPAVKGRGRSTSGTPTLDFSGVASQILRKRRSG